MKTLAQTLVPAGLLLPLVLSACTTSGSRASGAAKGEPGDLELRGSRIIGCCCSIPCACRLNKKPMNSHGCDHSDAVHIESGNIGDVDMAGVDYVIVGRGFGQDAAKNWTYVYVSDRATPEQYAALEGMLGGMVQAWGPKAKYLAGDFVGMRKVPMTYTISADRRAHACKIPGVLDIQTKAIVNPGHTEPVVSTGVLDAFGDRFVHADTVVHEYSDKSIGRGWKLTGRQSNHADFVLTDERIATHEVGWGCWTAHADLGDRGEYGEEQLGHDGAH